MKKKIIIMLSIVIICTMMVIVLLFLKNDNPDIKYTEDEIKFKDEYENLNGQELSNDYILKNVNIDADNNVKYVFDHEIIKLLTNGTNVIYLGWSECNWCRSIVSPLIETLKENNVETLYYYNFKSLRNNYENNDDTEKVKLYEDIINIIGEDIETLFDENSTRKGQKKILAPTVIFIKDGKYLGLHFKSVDNHVNSTDVLNDKQISELKDIYKSYINKLNPNICEDEGC